MSALTKPTISFALLVSILVAIGDAGFAGDASLAGKSCPAGSVVTGFTSAGELKCAALPAVSCAADEYMRGVALASGTPVCGKLKDRFYTRRSSTMVSVNLSESPNLYTGVATCDAGDIAVSGGGRCAASDYGMTATFPMLKDGTLGTAGALSAASGDSWRFNCSLANGPGAASFGQVLCLKTK